MKTIDVPLPPRLPFFPIDAKLTLLDDEGRRCEGMDRVVVPASSWIIDGLGMTNGVAIEMGLCHDTRFLATSVFIELRDGRSIDVRLTMPKLLRYRDSVTFSPKALTIA